MPIVAMRVYVELPAELVGNDFSGDICSQRGTC